MAKLNACLPRSAHRDKAYAAGIPRKSASAALNRLFRNDAENALCQSEV
jgi:hypothetical protein